MSRQRALEGHQVASRLGCRRRVVRDRYVAGTNPVQRLQRRLNRRGLRRRRRRQGNRRRGRARVRQRERAAGRRRNWLGLDLQQIEVLPRQRTAERHLQVRHAAVQRTAHRDRAPDRRQGGVQGRRNRLRRGVEGQRRRCVQPPVVGQTQRERARRRTGGQRDVLPLVRPAAARADQFHRQRRAWQRRRLGCDHARRAAKTNHVALRQNLRLWVKLDRHVRVAGQAGQSLLQPPSVVADVVLRKTNRLGLAPVAHSIITAGPHAGRRDPDRLDLAQSRRSGHQFRHGRGYRGRILPRHVQRDRLDFVHPGPGRGQPRHGHHARLRRRRLDRQARHVRPRQRAYERDLVPAGTGARHDYVARTDPRQAGQSRLHLGRHRHIAVAGRRRRHGGLALVPQRDSPEGVGRYQQPVSGMDRSRRDARMVRLDPHIDRHRQIGARHGQRIGSDERRQPRRRLQAGPMPTRIRPIGDQGQGEIHAA